MSSPFQSRLFALTRSDAFVAELAESLLALCRIDTGPNPDVRVMAQRERAVFDLIEGALRRDGMPELLIERRPVAPGIAARSEEHTSELQSP